MTTVADHLLERLPAGGVRGIFGIPATGSWGSWAP